MATRRRLGRALVFIALIIILLLVLVLVFFRFNPFGGGLPGATPPVVSQSTPVTAPVQQTDVVNIVVTTQDVQRGQTLNDELLAVVAIPRADYTEGVFYKDKNELIGARAKFDLKAHTPLTNAIIVSSNTVGSIPSFEIPAGKVAISIPVNKLSAVSYGLQKGDHVNVIASLLLVDLDTNFQSILPNRTGVVIAPGPVGGADGKPGQTNVTASMDTPPGYDVANLMGRIEIDPTLNNPVYVIPSERQRSRMVSQTLLQDGVVLQMGSFNQPAQPANVQPTAQPEPTQPGDTPTPAPAPTEPDVVTLIVEPQDAVTLNYLMLAGANLNLVMRSAGDSQVKTTEAVTLQFILDQYHIPNPAKLPYGLEPRMDGFSGPRIAPTATPAP